MALTRTEVIISKLLRNISKTQPLKTLVFMMNFNN